MTITHQIISGLLLTSLFTFLLSCSSKPILPESKSVKISRDAAAQSCIDLGVVYGKTLNSIGKVEEQALNDLKENAAKKGANYVYLQDYGAQGSSVKGVAYNCP
jgi:hypothetical protein